MILLSHKNTFCAIINIYCNRIAKGEEMKICVIGTGYVGLVAGTCLADMGNDVICVDNDLEKLRKVPMDRIIQIRKNLLEAEYRVKTGEMSFYELPIELAMLN